jgi:acid phosphatase type 7
MACAQTDVDYNGGNGTATRCRQRYVSDLVASPAPAAFLDLGDNQYVNGELSNYQSVYGPTFGRSNGVAYPSLGNAEYGTPGAQGFFDYFSNAGVFARILAGGGNSANLTTGGYYSYDVGTWHIVALNSNCAEVGGCDAGSPQEAWLRADLAAHPNRCTLAYWHHPRWNSGALGNDASTAAFWADLYSAGADLVLNGHGNHHYERFKPQDANGNPDSALGIREFIVSTGGESHGTPPRRPGDQTTSQITNYTSYGVLRLTLHPSGYDWSFVPEAGTTVPPGPGSGFTDSGSGTCHDPASTPPPSSSFPTTGVLDSFARGAGGLGSSWQSPGLVDPGTVSIASSGLTIGSAAGASSATWSAASFAADQEAYLTIPTLPAAGDFIQVAGRLNTLSTSGISCYFLRVTPSTSTWDLRKKINGANSTSIRTFTAPLNAGDAIGLQLTGTTLTAYRKPAGGSWSAIGSTTDSAITTGGYIAFTLGDTTMRGGPFGGGNTS